MPDVQRALAIWALDSAARQEDGPDLNACLTIAGARFDKAAAQEGLLLVGFPRRSGPSGPHTPSTRRRGRDLPRRCEDGGAARARELRKAKDGAGSGAGAAASSASASGVVEGFNMPTF